MVWLENPEEITAKFALGETLEVRIIVPFEHLFLF
jgi:hypothetical protein